MDRASPDARRARARREGETVCRDYARGEGGDGRHVSYAERRDVWTGGGHAPSRFAMPLRLTLDFDSRRDSSHLYRPIDSRLDPDKQKQTKISSRKSRKVSRKKGEFFPAKPVLHSEPREAREPIDAASALSHARIRRL